MTSTASFIALRKQKANANSNSSISKPQNSSQCHSLSMKPRVFELPIGRPDNHISIIKVFVLLLLTVLLFLNIISALFNYNLIPSMISTFSIFPLSSNSTSPSFLSIYSKPELNTYSHSNLNASIPPLDLDSSLNATTILNSSHPLESYSHPSPSPQPYSDLISIPPVQPSSSSISFHQSPSSLDITPINSDYQRPSPQTKLETPPSPPPSPPRPFPPLPLSTTKSNSRKMLKNCDLSQGEWVRDWNAPYYTNKTCYTIQEHQNCIKYGRPNLDFLNWRWKPDSCELPLFDPDEFLKLMRGKTLAFVGDSLARNQMQSLMCLLSRVMHPEDISENSDDKFKHMYYSAYNFTITIFWSPFLIRAKESKGPEYKLWNFYLDEVDDKWASHIGEFDYIIISGGNWFNRPSIFYQKKKLVGCLYCPNKKVTHRTMHYSHRKAFQTAFQAINKSKKFKGMVILRTLSPAHFENGIWDKGGDCLRTKPFKRNDTKLTEEDILLYKAQLEEFQKAKRQGRNKGIDFKILDTTNPMLLRPDGHPSRYGHSPGAKVTLYNDCVHWCLPGPVDMWNDVLLQMLSV